MATIITKHESTGTGDAPIGADLAMGELSVNTVDGKLWTGVTANGTPKLLVGGTVNPGTADGQTLRWEDSTSTWDATSALFVGDTGNVGIGTTAPNSPLQIRKDTPSQRPSLLIIENGANSNDVGASIAWQGNSLGNIDNARITSAREGGSLGQYLSFSTTTDITTDSVAERMRIDSLGNVLVAGAPSLAPLSVNGTSVVYGGTGYSFRVATAFSDAMVSLQAGNTADDTGWKDRIKFDGFGQRISFWTSAAGNPDLERMAIDQNGKVLIGSQVQISSEQFGVTSAGVAAELYRQSATGTAGLINGRSDVGGAASVVFNVAVNGDVKNTNNSYGGLSDISLKENIVPADSQLADLMALNVVNYNLKTNPSEQHIGLIAQEVEQVSPGLVTEGEDGLKSVKYSVLYMKAIKALQELTIRVEALEQVAP
jgi:hypothetical protein